MLETKLTKTIEMWDKSAKIASNRMEAVHFNIKGKSLDETIFDDIFNYINQLLEFKPDDLVLELGAGSGLLLERIAPHVKNIMGTDVSETMLHWIPRKYNIFVAKMDSTNLGFPDNHFDKAICYSVFQYFPDKYYALNVFKEIVRVCKKGGVIFIGDIFNGYLQDIYLEQHFKSLTWKEKISLCIKGRSSALNEMYLFLEPFEVYKWCKDSSCTNFKALLQISQHKPLLHRMFRFDALIIK
jgi:SAM-dependent methyltransferase